MMLLQMDVLQIGGGVLLTVNTALLLKLSFGAGRLVEQVEGHEKRITRLEDDKQESEL